MKIHHVLLEDFLGRETMETLCNRIIMKVRNETSYSFVTEASNTIQCVSDPRDVTCNTCQHVWRGIKGVARG